MRLCHPALERPDLQFPSKELARWMQAPTVRNLEAFKQVARYLIERGLLIQEFVRQVEEPFGGVVAKIVEPIHCSSRTSRSGRRTYRRCSSASFRYRVCQHVDV